LNLLLEIDTNADKSCDLSFGLEEEYGKPAQKMKTLGGERVISLGEIKKYYDRLGSYLHTPTLEQAAQGKGATSETIRARCSDVSEILEHVLSSPVFNVNFKIASSISCDKCGTKIVRRTPEDSNKSFIARCIECSASYKLYLADNNKIRWEPQIQDIECANPSCSNILKIWESDLKLGKTWKCLDCGGNNQIVLGLTFTPKSNT
jgi:hypothetical protein